MKSKAVKLYGVNDLRLEEFELPEITDDEILIKIISDSVCMSTVKEVHLGEAHIRVPENIKEKPPIVGHEFSGIIIKVGKNWQNKYKEKEKFIIKPETPGQMEAPGYSYEYLGGNATYGIVPKEIIEKGGLLHYGGDSFYKGSLSEPLFCCIGGFNSVFHSVYQSYEKINGPKINGNLIILGGCGPMGLMALLYGLQMENKPQRIVITDKDENRLDRAKKYISEEYASKKGVELHFVNTGKVKDEYSTLMSLTDNKGYDDVFVFAPITPLVEMGNKIMAVDGCMNLFAGPQDKDFSATINMYNCHYKKTKILGSSGGIKSDFDLANTLVSNKTIDPSLIMTHIGGLDATIDTIKNLPNIPGGKKMIYCQINMPLTAIDEFEEKGKTDPLFKKLDEICKEHNGLWSKQAEDYLLDYYHIDR